MELWLSRSLSHELFFFTVEFWLSWSLFTNFSFARWNSGYHEAFSQIFLSHGGISSIMEPFTNFLSHVESQLSRSLSRIFFCTIEFWLSRSLFTNFSFTRWNLRYHGVFHEFSLSHNGIHKMHDLGEDSFHIYHKEYLHRIHLVKNLAWVRSSLF
jgi:hypothetical protein